MRRVRLPFEVKLLLVFGVFMAVVLNYGSGNMSFEEALSKAHIDKSSLSSSRLSKLEKFQTRFFAEALPACLESRGNVADNFTLVIEVGSNGQVARSWRQGDSEFVICFQKLVTDNFFTFRLGNRSLPHLSTVMHPDQGKISQSLLVSGTLSKFRQWADRE